MIKRLIVIFLLSQSGFASACDKKIEIAYPPFVNLLTINKFFKNFHKKLASELDCQVNYILIKSFEEMLDGLLSYRYDAVLLPGAYNSVATELGYELVSTIERNNSVFIIASKQFEGVKFSDFSGLKILILDRFSASGARFEQTMSDLNLLSKISLIEGASYERMMLAVMAGKADVAVIIPEYWNLLSPEIRDKHLKIIMELPSLSSGIVTPPDREDFNKVLYRVLKDETSLKWGEPQLSMDQLPILDKFIKNKVLENIK